MRIHGVLAISLLLAVATTAGAGDYYKWTDAQGTVHYSQTKPVAHPFESVYVSDGTTTLPLQGAAPQSAERTAATQAGDSALQNANAQALAANCATARHNATTLAGRKPVAHTDNNPDVRSLTPEEREQALADAKKQVATYCEHKP